MDIKEKITEIVEELSKDNSLMEQFKTEPVKVIEKFAGVDLPDDMIEKVIDGVKAKIALDDVAEVADKLKGLFQ